MKVIAAVRIILVILFVVTTYLMLTPRPPEIDTGLAHIDKIEHAAVFAVLSFLFSLSMIGLKNSRIRRFVSAVLILCAYGIIMEYLQILTGRNFELADMAADAAGVLAGGAVSFFFFD